MHAGTPTPVLVLAAVLAAGCAVTPSPPPTGTTDRRASTTAAAPAAPATASTTTAAPATPPTGFPTAARPGEVVPLNQFFARRETMWGFRPSPDGTRIGWIGSHAGRHTVQFKVIGSDVARPIDTHSPRTIFGFAWARDSRRILYTQDQDGDENYHVYLASTERPDERPIDLTPEAGNRAFIARIPRSDPKHIVIGWNKRDRTLFDLYRVTLDTHEAVLIAKNPGGVIDWHVDWDGRVRARVRSAGPDARRLEIVRDGQWIEIQRLDLEEFEVQILGVTADDRALWMLSGRGRDRRALVRLDLATGVETVVHEHPELDLEWVVMSERARAPLAARRLHQPRPPSHSLPRRRRGRRARRGGAPQHADRLSRHRLRRSGAVVHGPGLRREGLGDVARGPGRAGADAAGPVAPRAICRLARPDGAHHVHGPRRRPHARLSHAATRLLPARAAGAARPRRPLDPRLLGLRPRIVQFFANRGYAVLQVNYRGSSGYGRRFRELAIGQYAGAMHDDLVDAVRWAVAQGVADPTRVAIHGGSYGGYSALVGMTFTPDVFACGVAVVPISNLLSFYEKIPPYWKDTYVPRFHKYVGDPSRPEDRRRLEDKSPLFKVDRVQHPVLLIHGARDTRVNVRESEQIAEALRRAGKDVRLIVFPDEGHRRDYGNWRNALRHYREIEDFLASCLGGSRS